MAVGSLASVLIVEIRGEAGDGEYIRQCGENFYGMTGRHQTVYVLAEDGDQDVEKYQYSCIRMPKEVDVEKGEASLVQSLIQNSRRIVS